MQSFLDKKEYFEHDVLSLIRNQAEESINLDFKAAGALGKTEGKRREISKDISAFANSNGGVIIYGIHEENHVAHSLSFIDGNEFPKEWLEHIINSTVQRHIPGLQIFPIRFDNDISKTVYIVRIPESIEAPHICRDKRFYRRFDFESVAMEEYEIRQLYGRKVNSELGVGGYTIGFAENNNEDEITLVFIARIYNKGEIVEKNYKTNWYFNSENIDLINFHWEALGKKHDYTQIFNNRVKISGVNEIPIFPEETIETTNFHGTIKLNKLEAALKNSTFEIVVLHGNRRDTLEGNFENTLLQLQKGHWK